ncbi:phage tail protein [Pectobacterium aquaticum]|uniref:phage tail protein n=1 Tax=Pectobacterium aquaticum TaxID=2204145 RepID=UPI000E288DD4|nr:phage tail protein [Pectobacterium aquaticum]RRN97122.1 phage tail protein [Pectobacterium aquaticum]
MSATYFALLTNIGAAKLANATTLGSRLNITRMAVGDGGGVLPTPNPAQTKLINEKRRAALNNLSIDPKNPSQIIAEQVIPENEGGWWVREVGLFDDDGNLIAVANCPETYKPLLQQGSGRIQTVRMILIVSSTDAVTLKIDPAVVLATRGYVDDALAEHEKSRKHPDGTLTAKGFVQLSSATNSDSELLAATPKAVKAANDNANGRVPSGRKVNGKALTADITLGAGDVGAYTKLETDTAVSVATTAANTAATAAANANTNANGRVPSGRKVNGKALSADIVLTAGDVGALTAGGTAAAATKLATARKINGVAFDGTADISVDSDWSQIKNVPAASYDVAGVVLLSSSINSNSRTIAATAQQLFTAHSIATNAQAKANAALPADGTAAAATKLATPRKINGVAFDGTADITLTPENLGFGKIGLVPVALLQFSSHLMQSLNFTALSNDTLEVVFEIRSHGRFVEVGKTLLFLLENNATAIPGKSTSRCNPVGKFVVTSMTFLAGNNNQATIRILYQNHGIPIGNSKTFRVAGFIYREVGCAWMGHASTAGASMNSYYMTLNAPLSSPNMPVMGMASTNSYGFDDSLGTVTIGSDNQPCAMSVAMMGNAAVSFAISDTDSAATTITDMATIIVYDIV